MLTSAHSARIVAVDFWRGVCLLMIFINHIPENPLSVFTLRNWGFADAAEVFVFLAGFSATLAFSPYFRDGGFFCGVLRVAKRSWQLFCAHVLLVITLSTVIAIAGLFMDIKPIMEQLNFSPFFVETDIAILQLVKLQYMPSMTDILPIYVVFIAMFPVLWLLMRWSPYAALAVSATLWFWANITGCTFANYPEGRTWFFNPLAWQFLFVLGAIAASQRSAMHTLLRSNVLLIISVLITLVSAVAAAPWVHFMPLSDFRIIPADFLSLDDKSNLSSIRMLHFIAVAFLVLRLIPAQNNFWRNRIVNFIAITGGHSLAVYCVGVVLALAARIYLCRAPADTFKFFLVDGFGLIFLIGLALTLEKASDKLASVQRLFRHSNLERVSS